MAVRELPSFLAPLTGALAFASCAAMVALHLYGASLPDRHVAQVVAEIPVPADQAWALLSAFDRRAEWRPNVTVIGRMDADGPNAVWTEVDIYEDRFDFVVVSAEPMTLVLATARPDDIGMYAEWRWSIAPTGAGGALVTAREEGRIENDLVRGWWALRTGPYAGIEPDLRAFVAELGGDPGLVRRTD